MVPADIDRLQQLETLQDLHRLDMIIRQVDFPGVFEVSNERVECEYLRGLE